MTHDPQSKILAYLKAGGKLTVRKAERLYHTTELRRIISRLRKMGYSICSNRQKAVEIQAVDLHYELLGTFGSVDAIFAV